MGGVIIKIGGFQKVTLLDFPSKVACIVFTKGCNYKCPYCQNGSLVLNTSDGDLVDLEEIFSYLEKRKKVLDGVCISGGEPLIQKNIKELLIKIKKMGFLIKLDTNGTNPLMLEELINLGLVDYVAMDIKNSFSKYSVTVGGGNPFLDNIKKSIEILEKNNVPHEFRTTIVKELHTINDILEIGKLFCPKTKYYLQNYEESDNVIEKGLHGFSYLELEKLKNNLKKTMPNLIIRGI